MALQMLRRAVSAGTRSAIFFSFEHDAHAILERLIAIEAAELDGETLSLNTIRSVFEARHTRASSVEQQFANTKGGAKAVRGLERYADRLHIHSSSGMHTGIGEIRAAIEAVTRDTGQARLSSSTTSRRSRRASWGSTRRSASPTSWSSSRTSR